MSMYKLKNCKDVTLNDNETSGLEFLDGDNIDRLDANRNKAGINSEKDSIVEKLEQIINLLNESGNANATFAVESLKEELIEESPSQPRIEKWQQRAKSAISSISIASDLVKKTNEVIDSVSTLFN